MFSGRSLWISLSVLLSISLFAACSFAQSAPTITTVTPATGYVGTRVTIAGSGFGSTQGSVSFGGGTAAIQSWSDNQIVCIVPDEAISGSIVATAQGVSSNQAVFQIAPPTITGISWPYGGPGVERTIYGANFGNIPRQITFNGVPAQIDTWSDTAISAFIPDMQRTGPVMVTAHGEQSNSVTFNFVRAIRPAFSFGTTLNLFITPDEATLIVGETHRLRLIDAQGVEQTANVTWSVDDQQVADITIDTQTSKASLEALSPGIVTITANSDLGSAKAEYTIIAGDSLPSAIPLWMLYPETEEGWIYPWYNIKAAASSSDDPYVYLVDTHPWDLPQTVFAVRDDGSIKWKTKLNYGFYYVAGTNDGDILVVSDNGPDGQSPQAIRKYSKLDGSLAWEQTQFAGLGVPAVAFDDTIYVEETTNTTNNIVVINGANGNFVRVPTPGGVGTTWNSVESYPNQPDRKPCAGNAIIPNPQANAGDVMGPWVAADGRAYLSAGWTSTSEFDFDNCTWGQDPNTGENVIFSASGQYTLAVQGSILSIGPDGSAQSISLGNISHTAHASYQRYGGINFDDGSMPGVGASSIVPDGNGGVLASWTASQSLSQGHLSQFGDGTQTQLPDLNGQLVATSEDRVFMSDGPNISAYEVPSGNFLWSIPTGQVWSQTTDGGLVVNTAGTDFNWEASTLSTFDGNGQPVGTRISVPNAASPVTEEAALVANDFGAMGLYALAPLPPDGLGCVLPNCNPKLQQAAKPGEFRSVQATGQCKDGGFDTHNLGDNKGADPTILPQKRYAALMVPGTPAAYADQTTAQIKVHLNDIKSGASVSIVNDPNNQWISTISPTTIPANSRDTIVTVTGHNDTEGLDDSKRPYLVVSQNGHPVLDAILDVKRGLTISVGLFTLHPTDGSELPKRAPSGAAPVETELIKDIGRQANILFTGQVHGVFDFGLDFEDANGKGLGYGDWKQGVGYSNSRLMGTLSTIPNIQKINAFYIQKFNPAGETVGLTTVGTGPSVIRDYSGDNNIQNTTAHELAHHLGAEDFEGGKEDSNHLMYKSVTNPAHPNPCHLTRDDWKKIAARKPKKEITIMNPDNTQTVTGTGFGVAFGTANYVTPTQTIPLQITSWSDTQIVVVLPPDITGGAVKFATANGQNF